MRTEKNQSAFPDPRVVALAKNSQFKCWTSVLVEGGLNPSEASELRDGMWRVVVMEYGNGIDEIDDLRRPVFDMAKDFHFMRELERG